jgi:hypothetical protein
LIVPQQAGDLQGFYPYERLLRTAMPGFVPLQALFPSGCIGAIQLGAFRALQRPPRLSKVDYPHQQCLNRDACRANRMATGSGTYA